MNVNQWNSFIFIEHHCEWRIKTKEKDIIHMDIAFKTIKIIHWMVLRSRDLLSFLDLEVVWASILYCIQCSFIYCILYTHQSANRSQLLEKQGFLLFVASILWYNFEWILHVQAFIFSTSLWLDDRWMNSSMDVWYWWTYEFLNCVCLYDTCVLW